MNFYNKISPSTNLDSIESSSVVQSLLAGLVFLAFVQKKEVEMALRTRMLRHSASREKVLLNGAIMRNPDMQFYCNFT